MQGGPYTLDSQVPPTLLTFVSQVPPTVFLHYLYICLPVSCDSLQTNGQCSSESSLEGSPNCFSPLSLHLSPSFLRFSANKWPVLQRKFFGGFPQLFFSTISTFVSQFPAILCKQMASAPAKALWRVPPTVFLPDLLDRGVGGVFFFWRYSTVY